MAEYFVDFDRSGTGTGTAADPWGPTQMTAINAAAGQDDVIINFAGFKRMYNRATSEFFLASGGSRGLFRQWANKPRWWCSGGVEVPSGWTQVGGTVWRCNLITLGLRTSGQDIGTVSGMYYDPNRLDSKGRRKCFPTRVSTFGGVTDGSDKCFYDPTGGDFYVSQPGLDLTTPTYTAKLDASRAADPVRTFAKIEFTPRSVATTTAGFTLQNVNSATVLGYRCDRPDPRLADVGGYGICGTGCVNCALVDCGGWDCGYHTFGFVASTNQNNQMMSVQAYCNGAYNGCTPIVMHSTAGDVLSPKVYSSIIRVGTLLGYDGTAQGVDLGGSNNFPGHCGIYCHTGGISSTTNYVVRDFDIVGCDIDCGPTCCLYTSVPVLGANLAPRKGLGGNPNATAQRVKNSTLTWSNCPNVKSGWTFFEDITVAFCSIDLRNGNLVGQNVYGSDGPVIGPGSGSSPFINFVGCSIIHQLNGNNGTALFSVYQGGTGAELCFDRGSIMLVSGSTAAGGLRLMISPDQSLNKRIQITESVLATTGNWWLGEAFNTATIAVQEQNRTTVLKGNIYIGFAGGFASNTNCDTMAKVVLFPSNNTQTAGFDPGAPSVSYSAADFVDPTVSAELAATSSLLAYARPCDGARVMKDLRGRFGTGPGAFAIGASPADLPVPLLSRRGS